MAAKEPVAHDNHLHNLRHSAAHLLAQAVLELHPDTIITIGPVTEAGFFYDFLPTKNFKEEDLGIIEAKMHEIAKRNDKIIHKTATKAEALEMYKDNRFKREIIEDQIKDDTVSLFCQGNFCDLCKGGHVASTGEIKYFKLTNISGAYWRADRQGTALQRISGVCFATQKELDAHLQFLEDVQKYDHRKLGKQLDLFSFNDVAAGFPFFHSKGLVIYNKLIEYARHILKDDYKEIKTPIIMHESLWKTSGHYDHYKENMYFTKIDEQEYCIKPMNCPGGVLMYKEKPRSYRELPLRLSEFGLVHRHELSGVLHGLFRVRAFTQDDAHVYCTPEQLESEILKLINLAQAVYKKFDFEKVKMFVATKPEKAMGDDALWQKATQALENALKQQGIPYDIDQGGGAFYGPKIDMKIEDNMGREWQCGTVQVDFFLPQNFELKYIASDQSKQTPIMLHRVLYGSMERFIGILTEHYKGKFPFWIAPVQVRVLTITDSEKEYALNVYQKLLAHNIRIEFDESGDQISAKIRKAQTDKIPWMIVIGQKEVAQNTVTLRHADGKQEFGVSLDALVNRAEELNKF